MTTSSTNFEEAKGNVDYSEDVERVSTANAADVANMERIELTEEDVSCFTAESIYWGLTMNATGQENLPED